MKQQKYMYSLNLLKKAHDKNRVVLMQFQFALLNILSQRFNEQKFSESGGMGPWRMKMISGKILDKPEWKINYF